MKENTLMVHLRDSVKGTVYNEVGEKFSLSSRERPRDKQVSGNKREKHAHILPLDLSSLLIRKNEKAK